MSLEIGLVILAIVIGMQLMPRPLGGDFRIPVVLAAIGLFESVSFLRDHHGGSLVAALVGSLVLAAVTGAIRAPSVKLWVKDGQVWRRGSWLTGVLWIASLAAHFGYDTLVTHGKVDVGSATILLYFAVSLTVQRLVLATRAARLPVSGGARSARSASGTSRAPSGRSAHDATGR
jgi:hypothetical protein